MRPNSGPLAQRHACFCGDTHPALTRLFSMHVLVCPQVQGPTLRLVMETRTWTTTPKTGARVLSAPLRHPGYLLVGEGAEPETPPDVLLANVEALVQQLTERVAALEAKKK